MIKMRMNKNKIFTIKNLTQATGSKFIRMKVVGLSHACQLPDYSNHKYGQQNTNRTIKNKVFLRVQYFVG